MTWSPLRSFVRCVALAAAPLLFAVAAPARADEVRLRDGRVLVGKVVQREKDGSLEITTRDGVLVVQRSEVQDWIPEDKLRESFADFAKGAGDTPFANLQLAMRAREKGLEPEQWRYLDRAVEQRTRRDCNEGLQRRLADFLAQLEPDVLPRRFRAATTKVRVHQLLDLVHASTGRSRTAVIDELLVREPGADQDLRIEARSNTNARQRIAALTALHRRQLAGNERFVLRTAVLDDTEQVREAAIALARPTVGTDDLEYMAAGLAHSNPQVRVRTAEALGGLGKPEAAKWLVAAGPSAGAGLAGGDGGNGNRGYIAILTQTSYVRDFDVEVAQAAAIAKPKVDVISAGSVLDVTVAGVVEERIIVRTYRSAIRQLGYGDPGEDPRKWSAWYANQSPPANAPATPAPAATGAPVTPKR
jgi:hypothetical protein